MKAKRLIKGNFLPSFVCGWGNGYVAVPPEHPLWGKTYTDKEFLSAQAEHGPYIDTSLNKNCTYYELPLVVVNASGIIVHSGGKQYSEIVEFHWQDGTPCGVLEEE